MPQCFKLQRLGAVAQLGERLNGIQEVVGSIPISSTTLAYVFLAHNSYKCLAVEVNLKYESCLKSLQSLKNGLVRRLDISNQS